MYKLSWFDPNSQYGFVYDINPCTHVVLQLKDGQWRFKYGLDWKRSSIYTPQGSYPEAVAACKLEQNDGIFFIDNQIWYPSTHNDKYLFHRGVPILCIDCNELTPLARKYMDSIIEYVLENQEVIDKLLPVDLCYFHKISTPWLVVGNKYKSIDFNELNFNILLGLYLNRP